MTPFERTVLAEVRKLAAAGKTIRSAAIEAVLDRHPNQIYKALQSLTAAGRLTSEIVVDKSGRYRAYALAPEPAVTELTSITICPPGFAEGYGLDRRFTVRRGTTRNGGENWC